MNSTFHIDSVEQMRGLGANKPLVMQNSFKEIIGNVNVKVNTAYRYSNAISLKQREMVSILVVDKRRLLSFKMVVFRDRQGRWERGSRFGSHALTDHYYVEVRAIEDRELLLGSCNLLTIFPL